LARKAMIHVLNEIELVKRIDLVTHPDNTKAINLYESLGFKIESTIENYFGDGEPRIVMVLSRN
jgi:ribosomal-protein-alanine N-acetyltransferase